MILRVRKNLGSLREIRIDENKMVFTDEISHFQAKEILEKSWFDYGNYNENTISLQTDGKEDLIKIQSFVFSPIVKDIYFFLKSNTTKRHIFTLEGRDTTSKLFEVEVYYDTEETLPGIIYSMIFISFLGNPVKGASFWNYMQGHYLNTLTTGKIIDMAIELNAISKRIISDYPFMEMTLQNGIERIITEAKERLDGLTILKI